MKEAAHPAARPGDRSPGPEDHAAALESVAVPAKLTVIEPTRGWVPVRIGELWRYRELLYFLVWREVKVRYKQTAIGALWVLLQPLLTMLVYTVIFGRIAKLPSDGIPYPVLVFSGLVPWMLFVSGITESGASLVAGSNLITKVYFPRLLLPTAAVLTGLVDFLLAFGLLIGFMAIYGLTPTIAVLALPLFVLLAVITAFSIGLWFSMLNVYYRDVKYTIPFVVQIWMLLTPVAYSSVAVPGKWRLVLGANPMTAVVEGFRWALLGKTPPSIAAVGLSVGVIAVLLVGGLIMFHRVERTFADVI